MSHRDTDERLRTRLNADQVGRERLCAALLATDRAYSRVEPMRPEGGPDGGRDLQALRDGVIVWGAVGFQNSVTDSSEDKRLAKAKFRGDLDVALSRNPELKGFAFFTNVDLTQSERAELEEAARKRGVPFVDVYWRERIRQILDTPEGLALRFQYLSMPLSDAEQAGFFARFGADLQDVVTQQNRSVLTRLEFLHHVSRPLWDIRVFLVLRERYAIDDIGNFRALAELHTLRRDQPSLWIGTDSELRHFDDHGTMLGQSTFFWTGKAQEQPNLLPIEGYSGGTTNTVMFGLSFTASFTPEILDGRIASFFVTDTLETKLAAVLVSVNGYAILQTSGHGPAPWNRAIPRCPWAQEPNSRGKIDSWKSSQTTNQFGLRWPTPEAISDALSKHRIA